jgi:hypothetical protein
MILFEARISEGCGREHDHAVDVNLREKNEGLLVSFFHWGREKTRGPHFLSDFFLAV